MQAIAAVLQKR